MYLNFISHNRSGLITIFLLFFLSYQVISQSTNSFIVDSIHPVDIEDYNNLKKKYVLDSLKLSRYNKDIDEFEKKDKSNPPKRNSILFIGSSTIALWQTRLASDMAPLYVVNRGFGGSVLLENIYYFPRIIKPYIPKIVVLYCENDITSDNANIIFEKVRYFEYLLHSEFPNTILLIVSYKPSTSRIAHFDKTIQVNSLLKLYAEKRPMTEFVDIFNAMLIDGKIDDSLFIHDKLHMNNKGYDLWTKIIKPKLFRLIKGQGHNQQQDLESYSPNVYMIGKSINIDCVSSNTPIKLFDIKGFEIPLVKNIEKELYSGKISKSGIYFVNYSKSKSTKVIVR